MRIMDGESSTIFYCSKKRFETDNLPDIVIILSHPAENGGGMGKPV